MIMVKIKLTGTKKDTTKTFYWIMTNGDTYSDELNVFHMSHSLLERLKKQEGLKWKLC